jgi:hypothetical protein
MPSVAVLEELAPGRTLVQIRGGTHDGEVLVVMGGGAHRDMRALSWYLDGEDPPQLWQLQTPEAKANALLESLLSPAQLLEWRRRRRFWVSSPQGKVQLGELYHLPFRPRAAGRTLVLCVVPDEPINRVRMPEPDVWANLLLVLRNDPARFFEVANWRFEDGGTWRRGPAPL